MGSPGTRRARKRRMLDAARAKGSAQVEPVVVEPEVVEPVVVEEVEAPKEGLLKKALGRGRRKKAQKKSEE